jgi:phage gp45-like
MLKMVRTIISSVTEGVIKRFSGSGRPDETFTNREYFQHYGFTSRPLKDAEGILIKDGNNIILIASDDRRYRIQVEDGEVALYTDEGDKIHLKRNKEINISSGGKVIVNAANLIEFNTGTTPKGVVTGDCICHFTGSPHGDVSTKVKASK